MPEYAVELSYTLRKSIVADNEEDAILKAKKSIISDIDNSKMIYKPNIRGLEFLLQLETTFKSKNTSVFIDDYSGG